MNIKFSPPDIGENEINNVIDTLKSGWITTGPKTKLFEKKIAEFCGTQKAVCLNSATACLELVLRLFGIGEGDEVITSAYTYTASASVIRHVGATIILADTKENSYFIDYDKLEKLITPKTKAIIPIDIGGIMCDYQKLISLAEAKKAMFSPCNEIQKALGRILILGDAAHSFGAYRNHIVSGYAADFTCFSFHAVKNLTTAEGGAVVWRNLNGIDNDFIYKQFMLMSLHGQTKDALSKTQSGAWEYDIIDTFYKCNMTDIHASIGLAQLERYPDLLKKRERIYNRYAEGFENTPILLQKHITDHYYSSLHLGLTRILGADEQKRNSVIHTLAQKGISTNVHYKPLPLMTAYKNLGFDITSYPNAYSQYINELTIPLHTLLTEEEIDYIISAYREAVNDL